MGLRRPAHCSCSVREGERRRSHLEEKANIMDPFDDASLFDVFDGKPQKRSRDDEGQANSQKRVKASKEYV